jgi:16S rRNA processing protein RimM
MGTHSDVVAIGYIAGVFGVRGEVKIEPMTYSIERFEEGLQVWIGTGPDAATLCTIETVRPQPPHVIVRFLGIDTRDACEVLVKKYMFAETPGRTALPPRTWFISDIVGLTVFSEAGEQIGTISAVLPMPANHVYVVVHGNREILIPAIREVVREVDLERRRMTIHVLDGLLDL